MPPKPPFSDTLRSQPGWVIVSTGVVLAVVFGVFDLFTEYNVSLFILYSLPIIFVAWFGGGTRALLFISIFSALTWEAADAHLHQPREGWVHVCGSVFFQFLFFSLVAFATRAIRQRLEHTEAQVSELERFLILAEISPVAIFRTGPEGECVYVNQQWGDLTGLPAERSLGQRWVAALHPDDEPRVSAEWAEARQRPAAPFRFQARFRRSGVEPAWALGQVAAERDATGAVCGYVGTVTDLTAQRRLEREILQISEREQQRIGQDLHDDLCQFLAAIRYASSSLRDDLKRRALPEAEAAREITDLLKDAISRTRGLARGIFPVQLESQGLVSALHELAANTSRLYGIACSFEYEPPLALDDSATATHLYRIAQEALANALKHGRARRITLCLRPEGAWAVLTIRDDGTGFSCDATTPCEGMGLRIMEYRSHMIGGRLTVAPDPEGRGMQVTCTFRKRPPL